MQCSGVEKVLLLVEIQCSGGDMDEDQNGVSLFFLVSSGGVKLHTYTYHVWAT